MQSLHPYQGDESFVEATGVRLVLDAPRTLKAEWIVYSLVICCGSIVPHFSFIAHDLTIFLRTEERRTSTMCTMTDVLRFGDLERKICSKVL